MYDVIVVGGGPAGLSGAMVLGRCRRKVLLFDENNPRNRSSHAMHSFLSRDGCDPREFLEKGREELKKYNVEQISARVVAVKKIRTGFEITDDNDRTYLSKKLLLATGIKDRLPKIKNINEFFGTSVFHCPYCDGWECREKKIAIYGKGKNGLGLSLALTAWSSDITWLTNGKVDFNKKEKSKLKSAGIKICTYPVTELIGTDGQLQKIRFKSGDEIDADAMFFTNGYDQSCDLIYTLNCEMTKRGVVKTNKFQETNVSGLYVAGDASRDMQLVIVAAAEGTKAGVAINMALTSEAIRS